MNFNRRTNVFSRLGKRYEEKLLAIGKELILPIIAGIILCTILLFPASRPIRFEYIFGLLSLTIGAVWVIRSQIPMWRLDPYVRQKAGYLLFLAALLCVGGIQISRAILLPNTDFGSQFAITAPLIASGLLVGAMLGPVASISFCTMLALSCMLAGVCDWKFAGTAWLATVGASHAIGDYKNRYDMLRAIAVALIIELIGAITIGFVDRKDWVLIISASGWAGMSALGAIAVFWLAHAAAERGFGITSNWGLLELCSPEHPLLRQLCTQAPGTYQHSIMMANLAEAAARDVGANPLLTRACAYYHDIGKLRRPDFFVENQGIANAHNRLSPSLSSMIITAHVKDGLELASEYKLPHQIRDCIAQHHGNSIISYFYHQAKAELDKEDPLLEEQYRYNGPKPRSKETAIIMLADTVEAATRAQERLSPAKLEHLISKLIASKQEDGQLDDSDLTLRDLRRIINSFVHTLTVSRHKRIEYPQGTIDETANANNTSSSFESIGN